MNDDRAYSVEKVSEELQAYAKDEENKGATMRARILHQAAKEIAEARPPPVTGVSDAKGAMIPHEYFLAFLDLYQMLGAKKDHAQIVAEAVEMCRNISQLGLMVSIVKLAVAAAVAKPPPAAAKGEVKLKYQRGRTQHHRHL